MWWVVVITVHIRQLTTLSTQSRKLTRLLSHSWRVNHKSILQEVSRKDEITDFLMSLMKIRTKLQTLYLPVESVHVYICFLGPLLPKLRVIQSNISAVLRRHKTGFGEGGSFSFALYCDGSRPSLKDLIDVLLTEATTFIVLVHYGCISTFTK